MCVSPVKPKCPIRIPVKSTNVTPSDIPKILILPKSTPTDITNAYKHTIWATEAGSHNKLSNQSIVTFVYLFISLLNFRAKVGIKREVAKGLLEFFFWNIGKGVRG